MYNTYLLSKRVDRWVYNILEIKCVTSVKRIHTSVGYNVRLVSDRINCRCGGCSRSAEQRSMVRGGTTCTRTRDVTSHLPPGLAAKGRALHKLVNLLLLPVCLSRAALSTDDALMRLCSSGRQTTMKTSDLEKFGCRGAQQFKLF